MDEIRSLISRQQELDDLIWDVFTLQRGTLPFVECSDGRLYSASSLRTWVKESYRSSGVIRSPMDQTVLRATGVVRTQRVIELAGQVGMTLTLDTSALPRLPLRDGTVIDLMRDLVSEPVEAGAEGDVVEWRVNIASKLSSESSIHMCVLAGLESEQEVIFSCRTLRQNYGRIQLMTAPPHDRFRLQFVSIMNELGIGAGGIMNPECLGTVPLRTSDGSTKSWEDRIIAAELISPDSA